MGQKPSHPTHALGVRRACLASTWRDRPHVRSRHRNTLVWALCWCREGTWNPDPPEDSGGFTAGDILQLPLD